MQVEEFRRRQKELIGRGEKLFEEVEKFGPYWNWNGGPRGETREILEEKVPMLTVYRDYYERWSKWSSDSAVFIREVAGPRSDSNRKFKETTTSTQKLFKTFHSPIKNIHEGISTQLEVVRTRMESLVNERYHRR